MRAVIDDLAAPARIRHAAIRLFGEKGFDVGLRTIAEKAGVSLGLIRHHFGSKGGLREACDGYVLGELARLQAEQLETDNPARSMLEQLASMDDYRPMMRYILQALSAGGPLAQGFWQQMVTDAENYLEKGVEAGHIKPSIDPAGRARFLTLMELGAMMLELSLAPDDEDFSLTWRRYVDGLTLPGLELYTQGLLADSSMLDTYLKHVKEQP